MTIFFIPIKLPSPIVNLVNTLELVTAFFVGLGLGALILALLLWSFRTGRLNRKRFNPVPAEVSAALDILATAVIVLGPFNNVLSSTAGARSMGLVEFRRLVHDPLAELVNRARQSGFAEELQAEVSVGMRGATLFIGAKAAKLRDGYVILLVDDRTDSMRLDDMRRDFVANVSHELKTPVGAIGLLAETIQGDTEDTEMVKRFAGNLVKESKRLANLIQDIIQLSRLQSSEVSTKAVCVDLNNVVHEAIDRTAQVAESQKVAVNYIEAEKTYVLGDFEMLCTAVKNLIENAIVYSEEGGQVGVGIKISGKNAEIAVTDSGIGIPADEQARIFERFYRVDQSRNRQTGGTGLGLSIVKHVAIKHRGEIRLFSKVGLGSTFTLCLPVADQETLESQNESLMEGQE